MFSGSRGRGATWPRSSARGWRCSSSIAYAPSTRRGTTPDECQATTLDLAARAAAFLGERGRVEPLGPLIRPPTSTRAAALAPRIRRLCSTDRLMVGHFSAEPAVLDFLVRAEAPRLAALGTSCPDH